MALGVVRHSSAARAVLNAMLAIDMLAMMPAETTSTTFVDRFVM
jgi:hypothetical protein